MTPIEKDSLASEYGTVLNIPDEQVPYIKTEQDLINALKKEGRKK